MSSVRGRLAPTPSGGLHLGNITAFGAAWLATRTQHGELLLRVEDIDPERSRQEWISAHRQDLQWLGLNWDREVPAQSTRNYAPWYEILEPGTYRCTCTRRQIRASGGVYTGTCRNAGHTEGSLRLNIPAGPIRYVDRHYGPILSDPMRFGDPVIARRDDVPTYNLAVVADDIRDGVTEVVRGADLLEYTSVQVCLWRAFSATPPSWMHSPLILGPDGKKLSKSHGAMEVAALRDAGWSPQAVWRLVLPWLGIANADTLSQAIDVFRPGEGPRGPIQLHYDDASTPQPHHVTWTTASET